MKFGSRIDLFLPPDATLRVDVGDRVQSGRDRARHSAVDALMAS